MNNNKKKHSIIVSILCMFCLPLYLSANNDISTKKNLPISVEFLKTFKPGISKISDIEKILGQPSKNLPVPKYPTDIAWIYFADNAIPYPRASFIFNANTKILISINWMLRDKDPEQNLQKAIAHFPGSHFVTKEAEWTNPHAAPDELFYIDYKNGITITYLQTPKRVDMITWEIPKQVKTKN